MQAKDLKPLSSLAQRRGVKMLGYGPPGGGKTPLMLTAPNPVCLVVESGVLSVRHATNVPAWHAKNTKEIDEFFLWAVKSKEANMFDTYCVDSITQVAEMYLNEAKLSVSHGLKAYGIMSEKVRAHVDAMYYGINKNVYMIAKQGVLQTDGGTTKAPGFPGQDLAQYIPHLFDLIAYIDVMQVTGIAAPTRAIRTAKTFGIEARDRSGRLAEFEPQDLTALFNKALS